jgi:predicted ArsR family transcriptional regulator
MHDTRWTVLELIRTTPQPTVASLADSLKVSQITVRHHLATLQAEGLIQMQPVREGVGRPKHIYSLTEAAQRYFPNQYHALVEGLLDTLKTTLPAEQVNHILDSMAAKVASKYHTVPVGGTLEQRLQHLVAILGEEGFMAEIREAGDGSGKVLAELNCPYQYVGQRHREVCRIDRLLIEQVLGQEVQQTSCILNGDHCCTFSLKEAQLS